MCGGVFVIELPFLSQIWYPWQKSLSCGVYKTCYIRAMHISCTYMYQQNQLLSIYEIDIHKDHAHCMPFISKPLPQLAYIGIDSLYFHLINVLLSKRFNTWYTYKHIHIHTYCSIAERLQRWHNMPEALDTSLGKILLLLSPVISTYPCEVYGDLSFYCKYFNQHGRDEILKW